MTCEAIGAVIGSAMGAGGGYLAAVETFFTTRQDNILKCTFQGALTGAIAGATLVYLGRKTCIAALNVLRELNRIGRSFSV